MIELEVLDGLETFRLVREDPLLDGSVPQRAARGCSPLLEGNALGLQVQLSAPLVLRRTLTGVAIEGSTAFRERARVMAPAFAARGLLSKEDAATAAPGATSKRGRVRLFTGLFLVPPPGTRVLVRPASARASRAIHLEPQTFAAAPGARPVPLFLEFTLRKGITELRLEGILATLIVVPSAAPTLTDASQDLRAELVRAHAGFYDEAYFEAKRRGKVTQKYKRLGPSPSATASVGGEARAEGALLTVAHFGPRLVEQVDDDIVVRAAFGFRARYDGSLVHVEAEEDERARFATATETVLGRELEKLGHAHQGARLYFSKYFTPHPAGEPHFFVKPPALIRTAPGWSTIVEGRAWPHCRTMRGVVRTDAFGAVPQVFDVFDPFQDVSVRAGEVLCTLVPVPRAMTDVRAKVTALGL